MRIHLVNALLVALLSVTVSSETLAELGRLGAARNPRVEAARIEWRASIEKLPQAGALPDPMVRIDWFGESVETRVGPQEYRYSISQAFPWPGTLAAKEREAAAVARIKHAQYDQAVRDLIVDLTVRYHELLYLRGALQITTQNKALLEHIVKVTNTRYARGEAKLRDVLRAQSQLAQLGYDTILLRELEAVETGRINALLNRPTATPIGDLERPPLRLVETSVADLEAAAVASRPEIAVADRQTARAAAAVEVARHRNRPTFSLNAMRIETGEAEMAVADSGKDPWLLGIGVSIPLWLDRNRSRVAEAQLHRDAAVARRRGLASDTRGEVKSLYFRLENARRLMVLYDDTLLPQAEQAMSLAEQWGEQETPDVAAFLETQSTWLNFNLARLRAVTDYQQYRARLEGLVGGPLPEVVQSEEIAE